MNSTTSKTVLSIMNVLFWIVFIGLCIETGALLFNYLFSIFINEKATYNLYKSLDLHQLFIEDKWQYHIVMTTYIIMSGLKAFIAYKVVKLFSILKLDQPFTSKTTKFVFDISYWSFITGVFAIFANSNAKWATKNILNVNLSWTGTELLFFAGLIYPIAVIMHRGTEIQNEHDLTV